VTPNPGEPAWKTLPEFMAHFKIGFLNGRDLVVGRINSVRRRNVPAMLAHYCENACLRGKRMKLLELKPCPGFFAALACAMAIYTPTCQAAEIGLSRQTVAGSVPPIAVAAVVISGQIETGDAKKVATLLADVRRNDDGHQIRRLLIDSPGGLVGEAIEIGRLLRANEFEIYLPGRLSCISACVLILAGGTSRSIFGKVGIDYPHFLRAAGPRDDVPALLAETRAAIREYFKSMGVAPSLADAMFSVPPGEVHFLSEEDLLKYHLH
jgi:hypothetical protein